MVLKPIVHKSANSTQPSAQSDSFAQAGKTQFTPHPPPDSEVFNHRGRGDSQPGVTPTFFSSSSSLTLSNDSFCSTFSPSENGIQSGGGSETKILLYANQRGLDNASREQLLARKMGYTALVIDALLKVWGAGQRFSERQALAKLQHFGIGRRTLRNALQCTPQSTGVFTTRLFPHVGMYHPKRGRPAQLYELPSAAEVARRLGLGRTLSDELKPDDLRGLTAYRIALYRELIRRQPKEYSRRWLAGRLGVSKRTIRDYDERAGIEVTPIIIRFELRRIDCNDFADDHKRDIPCRRHWIEHNGRRYPALKSIANRLIPLGGAEIMSQYSSMYALRNTEAAALHKRKAQEYLR